MTGRSARFGTFLAGALLLTMSRAAPGAQPAHAPQPRPAPLVFRAPLEDKVFPLLSLLEATPDVARLLRGSAPLAAMTGAARARLSKASSGCEAHVACLAAAFRIADADVESASETLRALYRTESAVRTMADGPMRESGLFEHDRPRSGDDLLSKAWRDAAAGINRVIDVYAKGRAPRYPAIDAPMFDVASEAYGRLMQTAVDVLDDGKDGMVLFFQPSLRFALTLLAINRRDEAGRLEPLELGENRAVVRRLTSIPWNDYRYTAIVIPGSGTDRPSLDLSPWGRLRLDLAVKRFRERKAPLLVVSGGFVHPSQTPFCEALEMKKALIRDYGVPEDAILVEPHARHTTTNLRNAARLLYRYGIPFDRPVLVTTDTYQSRMIEDPDFAARCERELGYQPHRVIARISPFDLEVAPLVESLHADATDPLDP